jgi:biotin operon repressor
VIDEFYRQIKKFYRPSLGILRTKLLSLQYRNQTNNNNKKIKNMEAKEKVLATMKEAGTPLNAGKIAELSGLDKKEVDKAMKQLKEEGAIVSPVRCKWAPAE